MNNVDEQLQKTIARLERQYSAYEDELNSSDEDGMLDVSLLCELANSIPYLISVIKEQQEKIDSGESKTILGLAEHLQELNGGSASFVANNIKHTKGLTAVISVYNGIKPASMIVDELYEWAENNNEEVKLLIEKLEQDMKWNENNPV